MKPVFAIPNTLALALSGYFALATAAYAASPSEGSHDGMDMQQAVPAAATEAAPSHSTPKPDDKSAGSSKAMDTDMDMGKMQGGSPPPDARDPNAYADGLHSGPMPGMDMVDSDTHGKLMIDQLEYGRSDDAESLNFDMQGWYGNDYNKIWLKAEGANTPDGLAATRTELLWDHAIATYWGAQLGLRHDFGEGPGRNWLAVGVQGLAPYWFDVEATLYAGESGRSAARVDLTYDLLLTQRLVLQPKLEFNLYGKSDPERAIGSGLADASFGLRLRYEISRQFAPYIGVNWDRKFGDTADFARSAGKQVQERQWVAGLRMWF
jgi:copper resistance protein B